MRRESRVSAVDIALPAFRFFMFMILIIKKTKLCIQFYRCYNHDYKNKAATASKCVCGAVLSCNTGRWQCNSFDRCYTRSLCQHARNEMHIFSLNKAIPRNIAQNKKLYSLERWITKWNAVRMCIFSFSREPRNVSSERDALYIASVSQVSPTTQHTVHTIFDAWATTMVVKRMKMDWNEITNQTNERKITKENEVKKK